MAKQKTTTKTAPGSDSQILSYRHPNKRVNNPDVGLVNPETDPAQPKTNWAYDPHLDPALQFDVQRAQIENPLHAHLVHHQAMPADTQIANLSCCGVQQLRDAHRQLAGEKRTGAVVCQERSSWFSNSLSLEWRAPPVCARFSDTSNKWQDTDTGNQVSFDKDPRPTNLGGG